MRSLLFVVVVVVVVVIGRCGVRNGLKSSGPCFGNDCDGLTQYGEVGV